MTFNIVPLIPKGSAVAELAYSNVSVGASTSVTLGLADATRRIVAFVGVVSGSVTGMTIGGVTATQITAVSNVINIGYAFVAHVPNGTSGTVTLSGSSEYKLILYSVYECSSSTAFDFGAVAGTALTLDVPDAGVVLGGRFQVAAAGTSWNGLDEDTDLISGVTGGSSGAHREIADAVSGYGVVASGGTLNTPVLIAVSFGP